MLDFFDGLEGSWILSRCIMPGGEMKGQAEFKREGKDKLKYYESGSLTLVNGQISSFEKRYDYVLTDDDEVKIYFADGVTKGTLFQILVLDGSKTIEAEHFCEPDNYVSEYNFSQLPDRIKISHKVPGQKKEYESKTTLTRA